MGASLFSRGPLSRCSLDARILDVPDQRQAISTLGSTTFFKAGHHDVLTMSQTIFAPGWCPPSPSRATSRHLKQSDDVKVALHHLCVRAWLGLHAPLAGVRRAGQGDFFQNTASAHKRLLSGRFVLPPYLSSCRPFIISLEESLRYFLALCFG